METTFPERNEPFEGARYYSRLLLALNDDKADEYLENFLSDVEAGTLYTSENIVNNFKKLHDFPSDKNYLYSKLEEQVRQLTHNMSDDYEKSSKHVKTYLINDKSLKEIIYYKKDGVLLREQILFADIQKVTLSTDIESMRRLAFTL